MKKAFTIREMIGFLADKNSPTYAHDLTTRALIGTQYACDARIGEITRKRIEYKRVYYQCQTCYTTHETKRKPESCRNCGGDAMKTKTAPDGFGPILPGITWGAFSREYEDQGYIEIRVRNLKQNKARENSREDKTIIYPTRWTQKPDLMPVAQWKDLVRLEQAILETWGEYYEEQARFKRGGEEDELFPFTTDTGRKMIKRVIGERTHILRASRATHLSYRMDQSEVQNQLGHKKADNTARYIHVFKERIISKF